VGTPAEGRRSSDRPEEATRAARNVFTPLRPERLPDKAVEQVLALIRSGRLSPGDRLPSERDMAARLGVSRTAFREAVRVLETLGVLRVLPGRGTRVCEAERSPLWAAAWLSEHTQAVLKVMEVRDALEAKAAALAARRATEEQIGRLEAHLEALRQARAEDRCEDVVAIDAAFHTAIAAAADNDILAEALAGVYESLREARRAVLSLPGRLRRLAREHEAIVEAIRARDPEGAARAARRHYERAKEEMAILLEGQVSGELLQRKG
jgi:GntR family transcriptional regulator, transcriptional repressor for pyruvate dehydrogenase complex